MAATVIQAIGRGIIYLLGGAVAHEVAPGKEGREQSVKDLGNVIFNNGATKMEQAETESEEGATPGVMTEACSTCEPPPECAELADDIRSTRDELTKRYEEM